MDITQYASPAAIKNMVEGFSALVGTLAPEEIDEYRAKIKNFVGAANINKYLAALPADQPISQFRMEEGQHISFLIDAADPEGEVIIFVKETAVPILKLSLHDLAALIADLPSIIANQPKIAA